MDFVGIRKDELYLIEIKNFFQYKNSTTKSIHQLATELVEKIEDTIRLFSIIEKFHQRKWYFRMFLTLVLKFPFLNREWDLWHRIYLLSMDQSKIHFVLFIQSDFDLDELKREINLLSPELTIELQLHHVTKEINFFDIYVKP